MTVSHLTQKSKQKSRQSGQKVPPKELPGLQPSGDPPAFNLKTMKSKVLFLVAGVIFLGIAISALWPPRNVLGAVLNIAAAAIFLLLGMIPQKPTRP
jgi:hypothetical protein